HLPGRPARPAAAAVNDRQLPRPAGPGPSVEPGAVAARVRHVGLVPARHLQIPERLRRADFRREVAEDRQFLEDPEVVGITVRWKRGVVLTLLAVELVEQRRTIRRRSTHEAAAVALFIARRDVRDACAKALL